MLFLSQEHRKMQSFNPNKGVGEFIFRTPLANYPNEAQIKKLAIVKENNLNTTII